MGGRVPDRRGTAFDHAASDEMSIYDVHGWRRNPGPNVVIIDGWNTRTALFLARHINIAVEVIADFLARLAAFASLGLAPQNLGAVPAAYKFRGCVTDRVVLNGPPDVASPSASLRV